MRHVLVFLAVVVASLMIIMGASGLLNSPLAHKRVLPPYQSPEGYVCHRARGPITIDGKLNEPEWLSAPWTADFIDIEGDSRPKPGLRTRAKMLWDDDYFYVAAELEEPHVWATLTQRDSVIFHDNDFEVFIDPDGDNHEYYEFEINALNTGWDLFLTKPYKDGGSAIHGWDVAGLKTAVHVQGTLNDPRDVDQGWTVELAFPWKALKEATRVACPPKEGDQWRVNFSRVQWRLAVVQGNYQKVEGKREDNWVWSPQYVIDMHRPETWGYVQFTSLPVGQARFQRDASGPARHELMQVYYAQRDHRARTGSHAARLADLGLRELESRGIELRTMETGFEASLPLPGSGSPSSRLFVREDARLSIR